MDISEREEINQLDELEKIIDIENIPFEKLKDIIIGFTFDGLLSRDNLQKLNINSENEAIIRHYALQGKAFFDKSITKDALVEARASAWKTYKGLVDDSTSKNLLRLAIFCLSDEETSKYDHYGAEIYLESYFSSLFDLGSGYCTQFRHYVQENVLNP